jgi:hypothetical protein
LSCSLCYDEPPKACRLYQNAERQKDGTEGRKTAAGAICTQIRSTGYPHCRASLLFCFVKRNSEYLQRPIKNLAKLIMRRLSAGLLLVLFALSIMPKKTLHDALAHHQDLTFSLDDANTPIFHASGFWCHCDNLVVEFPFLSAGLGFEVSRIPRSGSYRPNHAPDFLTNLPLYAALRGPPAVQA